MNQTTFRHTPVALLKQAAWCFAGMLLLCTTLPFQLRAAEVSCLGRGHAPCGSIQLRGTIQPGDVKKVQELLRRQEPGAVSTMYLASLGGNVTEALAIGRFVRRQLLSTEAPFRLGNKWNHGPSAWQRGSETACAT